MVRLAILSKKGLQEHPYADWMKQKTQKEVEIVLYASDEDSYAKHLKMSDTQNYQAIHIFNNWKNNRQVDFALIEAHRQKPFDAIIALSECDQLRAAELREYLNIPGQHIKSAHAFRNKLLMKQYAQEAGLAVPKFAEVKTPFDVEDFISNEHGQFILKPIDGAGANQVQLITHHGEVKSILNTITSHLDESPYLMIEEYIDVPMLMIDGLMKENEILFASVASYTTNCFDSVHHLSLRGGLQFDMSDVKAKAALTYVKILIKYVPNTNGLRSFHAELFDHPTRGMLLCEIACRTGGARIRDMVKAKYHVDLDYMATLGQAGFNPFDKTQIPLPNKQLFGYAVLPSPGKKLLQKPSTCPIPSVLDFHIKAEVGETLPAAKKASDYVVEVLFQAEDRQALSHIYRNIADWIKTEFRWE